MSNPYPHLFTPGKIGNYTIKNRIVQGPVELEASGFNGEFSDDYIRFYEQSAKAGTGLIITAYASVDDEYSQSFAGCQLKLTDRRQSGQLSKLARRVHKYGAKIMVQAYMAGRQAVPTEITGKRMIAPSPLGYSWHNQIPEEMTREQCKAVSRKFANAAEMLRDVGIDGIEVLAAGGYMLNQFLSPKSNIRTDEYGGSFENRTRIVKEIIEAIREKVGHDIIVSIRFSADEFLEGGYGLDEGIRLAKYFEELGFDCININNANQEKRYYIIEPIGIQTGWKSYIIRAIKDAVNIPVLSTNVLKKPEQAEEFLAQGLMDYAVFGRAFLADTEWVKKAQRGRSEEIKPCIGCLYCLERTGLYRRSMCAVNPKLLRDDEFPDRGKDLAGRKILVAGAGPAGMEAAITCRKRGADVTVYEARPKLGGAAAQGAKLPDKEPLGMLVKYYEAMAKKLEIPVIYNTPLTKELAEEIKPYAIFVATGARPRTIPGFEPDGKRVLFVDDVLEQDLTFEGKKVAVIGGGMTALEVAENIAAQGNTVSVIVRSDKLGKGVDPDNIVTPLEGLAKHGAKVLTLHTPIGVTDEGVQVRGTKDGVEKVIPADIVVLSVGGSPNSELCTELVGTAEYIIPVGDADHPGRVANATRTGFEQAYILETEDD